jgi:DNA-binding FadR family transcriptional regulator
MRNVKWLAALIAVLGVGMLAAGCGGDDDTSTVTSGSDTTAATTTEDTTSTSEDTGTSGSTPDDVYNACIDVIEGTAAEEASKPACEQARDAFQQCIDQANAAGGDAGDTAAQLCQDAADQTIDTLKTADAAG